MIEKRMNISVGTKEYQFRLRYRLENCKKSIIYSRLNIKHPEFMVKWSNADQVATFDKTTPSWYIELATLYECIFSGENNLEAIQPYLEEDLDARAATERFVLTQAQEYLLQYIEVRIYMYEAIIKSGLSRNEVESMQATVQMLKKEQERIQFAASDEE